MISLKSASVVYSFKYGFGKAHLLAFRLLSSSGPFLRLQSKLSWFHFARKKPKSWTLVIFIRW